MRNKQPYIEGRIENLHVRVLRQEIETLVLFEIDGVRFRMRCRAFSFKQGDLVRVKYCKQGYLGSLVALEVERRRMPLEYARDFELSVLDAARRTLSLVWDILITFGLIFFRHGGILRDLPCAQKRRILKPRRFFLHLRGACACCDDNYGIHLRSRLRY